jgi:hypothetical protein
LGTPRGEQNHNELGEPKRHIEQAGSVLVEAKTGQDDERAEGIRDSGPNIKQQAHGYSEVGFRLKKGLISFG